MQVVVEHHLLVVIMKKLFLLIALFVLPKFFGMMGVWLVAPVTEIITVMICLGYYAKGLDIIV